MMAALLGQHEELEAKALSKLMPLAFKRERVFGMYLRSSLRISSVRMKTKLVLVGAVWAAVGMLPVMAERNRMANAAEANCRIAFLILPYL
jgi:hypothetical protein